MWFWHSLPVGVQAVLSQTASVLQVFICDAVKVFRHRSEADVRPEQAQRGLGAARGLLAVFRSAGLIQRVPLLYDLRKAESFKFSPTGLDLRNRVCQQTWLIFFTFKCVGCCLYIPAVRPHFCHKHLALYFVQSGSVWPTSFGKIARTLLTEIKTQTLHESFSHKRWTNVAYTTLQFLGFWMKLPTSYWKIPILIELLLQLSMLKCVYRS